jgi:hypothetical protein
MRALAGAGRLVEEAPAVAEEGAAREEALAAEELRADLRLAET